MEKKTTIEYSCTDEVYCSWFKCLKCGCLDIMKEFKYCPNCGSKISGEKK